MQRFNLKFVTFAKKSEYFRNKIMEIKVKNNIYVDK